MVGDGFYTVNYLINETTIMRAEADGQQHLEPNPYNGTVLEIDILLRVNAEKA